VGTQRSRAVRRVLRAGTAHRAERPRRLSWTRLAGRGELHRRRRAGAPRRGALGRRARWWRRPQADRSVEAHVDRGAAAAGRRRLPLADRSGASCASGALETREPSCRALDDALVLVIALSVDPEASPRRRPPEPAAAAVVIREVVRTVHVREPWSLAAAAARRSERCVLPDPALAASLAIAVDPPGCRSAELAGFASLAQRGRGGARPQERGAAASFRRQRGRLSRG
jgi:hypothetical protein